jgi:hypothetical protein
MARVVKPDGRSEGFQPSRIPNGPNRRRLLKTSVILIILCIAHPGCSTPEPAAESPSVSDTRSELITQPRAVLQSQQIDPTVSGVAREFSGRLARNVGGNLQSLSETKGNIVARWDSPKCDWIEPEVIDLLVSVHREFKSEVKSLRGVRECGGKSNSYALSGVDFQRYRTGQINDPEVLKGIE